MAIGLSVRLSSLWMKLYSLPKDYVHIQAVRLARVPREHRLFCF
jgi:hypothetical protein